MKTYSYEEVFKDASSALVKNALKSLEKVTCPISNTLIESGDKVTLVLMPEQIQDSITYNEVVVKIDALKALNHRYFRGEVPRIALPQEIG